MIKITLPDGHYYDEMLTAQGQQRHHYNARWQWFHNTDQFSIRQKKEQAELLFTASASPLMCMGKMKVPSA